MISVYKLKPRFQKLLAPLLHSLHNAGVTANQITMAAIFLSVAIGFMFWFAENHHWMLLAVPIGLLLRMALNALDGMMARVYHQQSKIGEVLNEIGDVVSDLFIYFPLTKYEPEVLYFIIIFICLSVINEFAGVLSKVVGGQRRYDGPMGKSDRALFIGLYGLLQFFHLWPDSYSLHIFLLIIALLLLSTFFRLKRSMINE